MKPNKDLMGLRNELKYCDFVKILCFIKGLKPLYDKILRFLKNVAIFEMDLKI